MQKETGISSPCVCVKEKEIHGSSFPLFLLHHGDDDDGFPLFLLPQSFFERPNPLPLSSFLRPKRPHDCRRLLRVHVGGRSVTLVVRKRETFLGPPQSGRENIPDA